MPLYLARSLRIPGKLVQDGAELTPIFQTFKRECNVNKSRTYLRGKTKCSDKIIDSEGNDEEMEK